MFWHTKAFAELIVPVESWFATLHPHALAAAGLIIPVLVWWAQLMLFALAFACLIVPNLFTLAELYLWAHAVTCVEAEEIRWNTFNLLFAYAHALNWIPVEWPNASNSNDFARTWNNNRIDACTLNSHILSNFSEDKGLRLDSQIRILLDL